MSVEKSLIDALGYIANDEQYRNRWAEWCERSKTSAG